MISARPASRPLARLCSRREPPRRSLPAALLVGLGIALGGCRDAAPPTAPATEGAGRAAPVSASALQSTGFDSPLPFREVSAGLAHTCGVTTENKAYCWGWNKFGQLGDGTKTDRKRPTAVAPGLAFSFKSVSVGNGHTCALTTENKAYCWGRNGSGQLGDGTKTERLGPGAVAGTLRFAAIEAGHDHTCGVTVATSTTPSRAHCWGSNSSGQLGDGTLTGRTRPTAVVGGLAFKSVSGGFDHTCGVTPENKAHCWGSNAGGKLGDGTTTPRRAPTAVAGALKFRQIVTGGNHTCAVTPENKAFCWGSNFNGQLGDGTTAQRLRPTAVIGELAFRSVSAGLNHTCGPTTENKAYCWGVNLHGTLGDGTTTQRVLPTAVASGLTFASLSAASNHTCAVTVSTIIRPPRAYCWGLNTQGQLGDGTTTTRLTPVAVVSPSDPGINPGGS